MDRLYEDVRQMVNQEIEAIVAKEEMSPNDLDMLDKLIDISKDVCEMDSMSMDKGMSGRSSYGTTMPYWGQISYEDYPNRGSSRGRSNMGRYNDGSSYGRYDNVDMRMMPRQEW